MLPVLRRSYHAPAAKSAAKKVIPVYPPVESVTKNVMAELQQKLLKQVDPENKKTELLKTLRAGDIIRYTKNQPTNQPPFVGMILGINKAGADTNLLLRNVVAKTAVETRVQFYTGNVDFIRRGKTKGRNKLYYIRGTKLDVDDLEAGLKRRKY